MGRGGSAVEFLSNNGAYGSHVGSSLQFGFEPADHSRGVRRSFKRATHGDPLIFNRTKLPEQSSHPNNPVPWVGRVNNGRPIEQAATGVCLCGSKVMECQNFRLH